MDKSQGFFDPYNFSKQPNNMPFMQNSIQPDQNIPLPMEMTGNPSMFYEQQYMYYKYLTQLLDYKIKLKEWEKINKDTK